MQMDLCQCFAVVPKAFQFALFLIPDGLCGTKKRDSNGLKLFGRVAIVSRAIVLVYRENNLGNRPRRRRSRVAEGRLNLQAESGNSCVPSKKPQLRSSGLSSQRAR